jgi:D-hydroxyproline dehydrogenase subunit gamma
MRPAVAPRGVIIRVNGRPIEVVPGTSVAAALVNCNVTARRSVTGEPRTALCGMGSCHECRVTVNGVAHVRGCLVEARDGMVVTTDA